MKSFAVIGSNSFTGSHIVDALLENPCHQVVGISRSPEYKDLFLPYKQRRQSQFSFHQLDLVSQLNDVVELLERVQPRVVINVAALSEVALSHSRPVEYFETNTMAAVRLCDYLRRCHSLERYVHISSAEVFGSCDRPASEKMPFSPTTPYAVSKAAVDMYLKTLADNFSFPVTVIRSTNVYGKHQQLFKIIPRSVIYLKLGRTVELHGGGKAIKSFVHIRDVVRGVMCVIDGGLSGTVHLTVPSEQTVGEVVRQICVQMGKDFESVTRDVEERSNQDARYWLDCSKATRELGWAPQVSFDDGVDEVIEWVERNWSVIQHEPLEYVHKVSRSVAMKVR